MTWSTAVSASGTVFELNTAWLVTRSRRRAHRGGRSPEGNTHAILARRQVEHGDNLSQRTFRLRQTTQLRSFGAGAGVDAEAATGTGSDAGIGTDPEPVDLALFSEAEGESAGPGLPDAENVAGGICDMLWTREISGSLPILNV